MKNNKSKPKVEYELFIPLVNLILFDRFESPDFNSDYEILSDNFIESLGTINVSKLEENFFTHRVYNYLKGLTDNSRSSLFEIIYNNDTYVASLILGHMVGNKTPLDDNSTLFSQEKIYTDLFLFKDDGKLSKSIFIYFILQFEAIFDFEFSLEKSITKFEYEKLLHEFCNPKNFAFK